MPLLSFFGSAAAGAVAAGPVPDFLYDDRSRGVTDPLSPTAGGVVQPVTLRGGEQHTISLHASRARTSRPGRTAATGLSCRVWLAETTESTTPIGGEGGPFDLTLDAITPTTGARTAEYRGVIDGAEIQTRLVEAGLSAVWRVAEWSTADGLFTTDLVRLPVESPEPVTLPDGVLLTVDGAYLTLPD